MSRDFIETRVEWINPIPSNWKLLKVKNCFYISKKKAQAKNPTVLKLARDAVKVRDISTNEGQIAASYDDYNPVFPGDFLLNPMDLYSGANCNVSEVEGVISPAYINLRKTRELNPKYFDYYFKVQYWTMAMFAHGKGVSFDNRWTLNAEGMKNYEIPFPNIDEQNKIVAVINKKCSQIDELIAIQEQEIEKLKAYKQSLITEVVTKGLDPNIETKNSGIDWVGDVPVNWINCKITHILDYNSTYPIGDGDHGIIKANDYQEGGIPYIRVQNLTYASDLSLDNIVYISEEQNEKIKNSTLKPNDIVFAKTGATIGKTGIIPPTLKISNTTSHVGKITVSDKFDPRYIYYFLSSKIGYKQFWDIALQKTTRPELSIEEIKSIRILSPSSKKDQQQISDFLDKKCLKIENLISTKHQKISKLNDYRKSLIYEYVTGKKEVT